jgi:hypothetical protein
VIVERMVVAGEPDSVRHTDPAGRIAEAVRARNEAERMLAEAVAAARNAGLSWAGIGACVGITGEAVRQRYGGTNRIRSVTTA